LKYSYCISEAVEWMFFVVSGLLQHPILCPIPQSLKLA